MKKLNLILALLFVLSYGKSYTQCNWFPRTTNSTTDYKDLCFPSENVRIIVGSYGVIQKSIDDGFYWITVTSNSYNNLNCVDFPSDSIGYTGGDYGTLLKTVDQGTTWTTLTLPLYSIINKLFFITNETGFVIGQEGSVLKTTDGGITWTTQTLSATSLNTIFFINQTTGWIAGEYGTIFKTTDAGETWTDLTYEVTDSYTSLVFTDSITGYIISNIVGAGGSIKKTIDGGSTWTTLSLPTNNQLYDIDFYSQTYGYAVGNGGTIIRTEDAGTTWDLIFANTQTSLQGIHIEYDEKYIVGGVGTLLVYASDLVVGQPYDKTVCAGSYTDMMISFASSTVVTSGIWQLNSGSGWNNCTNDGYHYNFQNAIMNIYNIDMSLNNNQYRYIYTSYCGTDTSDIATLTIIEPILGSILNLQTEYCKNDTNYVLEAVPAGGYFEGPGIVSNNEFNPFLAGENDTLNVAYYYTDINGCNTHIIDETVLLELPQIIFNDTTAIYPQCGSSNGFISVTGFGGLAPYSYYWQNGATTSDLTGISAGIYHVTVTDSKACANSDFIILGNSNGIFLEISETLASCSNLCDGSAFVSVFDGLPPYTYLWSNGQTSDSINNLCPQDYFVTVTDSAGCTNFTHIELGYLQEAAKISGYIYGGDLPIVGNLDVKLYRTVDSTIIEETNFDVSFGMQGNFLIENIPTGSYYLKVIPDNALNPQLASAFYSINTPVVSWDSATVINLQCGSYEYIYVYLFELSDIGTGPGIISGYIHQTTGGSKKGKGIYVSDANAKLVGEPVPGAEVYVELEPDDEPIANTQTDENGYYEVSGLPEGEYSINIQIPGVRMDSTYSVVITETDTIFSGLNFYVDTTGMAILDSTNYSVNELGNDLLAVSIYPNPFNNSFTFEYEISEKSNVKIDIFDFSGKCLGVFVNQSNQPGSITSQ